MTLALTRKSRVILIGVPEAGPLEPIPHAARSVWKLRQLLTNNDIVGLLDEQVVQLPLPEREDIGLVLQDIRAICKEARDCLVFYYCGHGLYGDEQSPLYLTLKDSTDDDKQVNALKISDIQSQIAQSPAKTRVMILDCCYSGAAFEGGMSDASDIKPAIRLSGTYGMASVPTNDKARFITGDEYPLFSGQLIRTLEYGIKDAAEILSIDDVFEHVREEISARKDVAVPVKEVRDSADKMALAKNVWALSGGVIRDILHNVGEIRDSFLALSKRVDLLELNGQVSARNPKREPLSNRTINLILFCFILTAAIAISILSERYDVISARLFFFVAAFTAFIAFAPTTSLGFGIILPKGIERSTVFWGALLSAGVLGSIDKQLEADLSRLLPFASADNTSSEPLDRLTEYRQIARQLVAFVDHGPENLERYLELADVSGLPVSKDSIPRTAALELIMNEENLEGNKEILAVLGTE